MMISHSRPFSGTSDKDESERGAKGSNREIEGIDRFVLEATPAFAKFSYCEAFHDFYHGFPDFLHDAADGATRFIGAGTFFVEPFADATDGCERAFDMPDDHRQGDFFGTPGQAVSACDTAPALDDSGGFEIVENLLQKTLGNVLLFGNRLDANHRLVIIQTQHQQSPQSVFSTNRKFHCHQCIIYSKKLKYYLNCTKPSKYRPKNNFNNLY